MKNTRILLELKKKRFFLRNEVLLVKIISVTFKNKTYLLI